MGVTDDSGSVGGCGPLRTEAFSWPSGFLRGGSRKDSSCPHKLLLSPSAYVGFSPSWLSKPQGDVPYFPSGDRKTTTQFPQRLGVLFLHSQVLMHLGVPRWREATAQSHDGLTNGGEDDATNGARRHGNALSGQADGDDNSRRQALLELSQALDYIRPRPPAWTFAPVVRYGTKSSTCPHRTEKS